MTACARCSTNSACCKVRSPADTRFQFQHRHADPPGGPAEDEEEWADEVDADGIRHDLLSELREADLLSKTKQLFNRVFREQIPT